MGCEAEARWHVVEKFINGRWYRYHQKSWNDNGKVRTRSVYLGPADGYVRRPNGQKMKQLQERIGNAGNAKRHQREIAQE